MRGLLGLIAGAGAMVLALHQPARAGAATRPANRITPAAWVQQRAEGIFDELQRGGDHDKALLAAINLFDHVIVSVPTTHAPAFREAAFARRLLMQLGQVARTDRPAIFAFLRQNPNLARTLAFAIDPHEKPAEVYAVLDRLRRQRGQVLETYATLATAICIVHDRPLDRRINENRARADDPLALFDYFCANERRMLFGIRSLPPELLIYVVDSTASVPEMLWALERYAGDTKVGARFFDIKYDHEHVRRGTPKQVTIEGLNLPNILRFGGVCADQAYFAAGVGKAIGVPTAIASGAASETGHAWVGFFQANDRQGWWNFEIGRYEAYRGVRGNVLDPQTRQSIPDSYVSLLAELVGTTPESRHAAVALTDAAHRLDELARSPREIPSDVDPPPIALPAPRPADVTAQLELLEAAVRQSPGQRAGWFAVRELAGAGRLSLDQKRRWATAIERTCGPKYPDFALAMLAPMIQTVEDLPEQNRLWNQAFDRFRSRADLAAAIRMAQAAMFESHGLIDDAGRCYMDVIERYANAGPFVIAALQKAEAALIKSNRPDRVLPLYEQTWRRIQPPRDALAGPFVTQSNWYRVGRLFAEKLQSAGAHQQADEIQSLLADRTASPGR